MDKRLYKHICGYPIKEGSGLERCPGCGGRVTPWNTSPAAQELPAPLGSGDEVLARLSFWLGEEHPELAAELLERVSDALETDQPEPICRMLIRMREDLHNALRLPHEEDEAA
jgi:hypothetical protein